MKNLHRILIVAGLSVAGLSLVIGHSCEKNKEREEILNRYKIFITRDVSQFSLNNYNNLIQRDLKKPENEYLKNAMRRKIIDIHDLEKVYAEKAKEKDYSF